MVLQNICSLRNRSFFNFIHFLIIVLSGYFGGIISDAMVTTLSCIVGFPFPRSTTGTIVNIALPTAVIVLFLLFRFIIKTIYGEDWSYLCKRCALSTMADFYISYISITKTAVNVINCISVYDSSTLMDDHQSYHWGFDTGI